MPNSSIPLAKIDALLRFLPAFQVPEREYIREWAGGDRLPDGSLTAVYPVYCRDVQAFFRLASEACWMDNAYRPNEAARLLEDEARLARASLDEVRTMLTYCVRGERFGDGFWEALLRPEGGRPSRVVALLQRLRTLREEMEQR